MAETTPTLKRSLEDAPEEGAKKMKSEGEEMLEIRVLIDNREASVIIGKAGANVKSIRAESTAFVSILKSEGSVSKERVMTVKGSDEAICNALKLIIDLLLNAANKDKTENAAENVGELDTQYSLKILIHKFLAGSIIGKGGAIIREIQETTQARLQLSNEPLAGSTEKTVTLTGTPATFHAAAVRVVAQLATNPLRGGSSTVLYVPGAAAAPAYGAPAYGAPGPYGAPPSPYGAPASQYGAPPQSQYGAPQSQYGAPAPSQYGGAPAQSQYGAPYGAPAGGPTGPTKVEKIVIPTVCAGTVIGKGGSIIRDIKMQSGCQITIADSEPTAPNDRVVAVTGSPTGIQTAIFLIRQRVESYQPPGPR